MIRPDKGNILKSYVEAELSTKCGELSERAMSIADQLCKASSLEERIVLQSELGLCIAEALTHAYCKGAAEGAKPFGAILAAAS